MSSTQERIDKLFEWREQCVLKCNDVDRLIEEHGFAAFPAEFHSSNAALRETLNECNRLCARWIHEHHAELKGVMVPKQQKRRMRKRMIALVIAGLVLFACVVL